MTGSRKRMAALALLGAVLVIAPLLDHNDSHFDFLANVGIYVLLALGLNIVVGFAGLLDLGYAAFSQSVRTRTPCWPVRSSTCICRFG
ncbi:MAG: hypothetical protein NVS1B14_00410 [Vulcanimicrobiaceae bacterium]